MKENPARTVPKGIIDLIDSAESIVLFTHTHPDGDALGSLLGFADVLESYSKKVCCFLEEPVSHLYDFLPNCEKVRIGLEEYQSFVHSADKSILAIALDCGDDYRLGLYKDEFLKIEPSIVIDHHESHINFGTHRWVDAKRSSTGEMIYEIVGALGANLSYASAYCLYVAICTDTGSFRYECTSGRTMQIAGELIAHGVRPEEIGTHLYDNYSKQRLKLLELVLSTIELEKNDQIAFMYVDDQMLDSSGATLEDVEGFIDFPRSLSSVKVAVFFKKAKDGNISASLRAKGDYNVAAVAKVFSGGGHKNAAGFKCQNKSLEMIRTEVGQVLNQLLD